MFIPLLSSKRGTSGMSAGASAVASTWDGESPYAPSVTITWPADNNAILTSVDNLTTGENLYSGPPTETEVVDTAPLPGVENEYRITHTYLGDFATRNVNDIEIDGVSVGRFQGVNCSFMTLRGSFTAGMGEEDRYGPPPEWMLNTAFRDAQSFGFRVIRLYFFGSYGGNGTLYPTLGGALDETIAVGLDRVLARASHWGFRVIPVLMDTHGYYGGDITVFGVWGATAAGDGTFYTSPTAKANFKAYLTLLLNRVNTFTGLAYKDDPVVLAWQLGNELDAGADSWDTEIANHIKTLATSSLVMSPRGVNPDQTVLVSGIDVASRHVYPMHVATITVIADAPVADNHPLLFDEYDWNSVLAGGDTLDAFLDEAEATPNAVAIMPWDLNTREPTGGWDQYGDDYAAGSYGLRRGQASTLTKQTRIVEASTAIHGEATADFVPAAPKILSVSVSGLITWRGAAGAITYRMERSVTSSSSGFASVATGLTDDSPTWTDPTPPTAVAWYRLVGISAGAVDGPPSNVVQIWG